MGTNVLNTIVKEIVIPADHKINLEVELPPDSPTGEAELRITIRLRGKGRHIEGKRPNRMAEMEGKYKGQIWMSDDFDAPLEDFKEYM